MATVLAASFTLSVADSGWASRRWPLRYQRRTRDVSRQLLEESRFGPVSSGLHFLG